MNDDEAAGSRVSVDRAALGALIDYADDFRWGHASEFGYGAQELEASDREFAAKVGALAIRSEEDGRDE
jgi:hypothetical protein